MLNRREALKGAIALAGLTTSGRALAAGPSVVGLVEERGRYLVEVEINGARGFRFVLDTGATAHFISSRAAQQLGLKQVEQRAVQGFDGSKRVPVVQISKLVAGGVNLGPARAIIWGPEQLEDHDGLIGYPFLYPSAMIDLGAAQVTLGGEGPDSMTAVQARVMRDQTLLVGGFDGAEGRFVFDTGSQSCTISADYQERISGTSAYRDAAKLVYHDAQGQAHVGAFRPVELAFGDFRIPFPIMRVGQADDQRAGAFFGVDALFGVSLIRPFSWAMDQAKATLAAAGPPPEKLGWYGSGLRITTDGRLARVSAVQRGGPAHQAGVRPGQAVLALGGRPPSRWSPGASTPSDRPTRQEIELVDKGVRRTVAFDTRELL